MTEPKDETPTWKVLLLLSAIFAPSIGLLIASKQLGWYTDHYGLLLIYLFLGGPIGLYAIARTAYLAVRLLKWPSVPVALSMTAAGIAAVASALLIGLGLENGILALMIAGAAQCTIMGLPFLQRFDLLSMLDADVRSRSGFKSWF